MDTQTSQSTVAQQNVAVVPSNTTDWTIDPAHTSVTFGVRHMMVSTVRGEFQKVSGTVHWDVANPSATAIDVTIDVGSINTREPKRDAHLRSADFFDAEKYPSITFRSRGVGQRKDGALEIVGDLTIRDTTRVVVLAVDGPTGEISDPYGFVRTGASTSLKIKRSDFGMTWNAALEAGGILVGDEISIQLDVELQRTK